MTLSNVASSIGYDCSGSVTYSVPFPFIADADIVVYRVSAAGIRSTLSLGADYSLTGAGDSSGGELTTVATYSDGHLFIVRDVAKTQRADLILGDGFRPDTLETELDRIVMQIQEVARKVGVAIRLHDTDESGADMVLPALEAGKVIKVNAAGTGLEFATPPADGAPGVSPTISIGTVSTVPYGDPATVVDVGTPFAAVFNFEVPTGPNGIAGTDGADGVGVPAGGTAGQVLAKASVTDYDTEWVTTVEGM